ncbi:hypothetical protein BGX21_007764, partial [Mortierella sp. AD011]
MSNIEVLFQQPHVLPTVVIAIILSVLIALYMDKKQNSGAEAPKPKAFAVPDT